MRLLVVLLAFASAAFAGPHPWPLKGPITVMDTLSTLQDYGGTPGFHHGLDLKAPAGTDVFAPVGGKVTAEYYYPRYKIAYTFRVSIEAPDGLRWELHHVDPATLPPAVRAAVASGGTVAEGALVARIADASAVGLPSHVHVEVIDNVGVRLDPLRFLPPLADDVAPTILGLYVVGKDGRAVAQQTDGAPRGTVPVNGSYSLVVEAEDMIPPGTWGDSLYGVEVTLNGRRLVWTRFDALPDVDYLKGVTDVYRTEPFTDLDGNSVDNQIDFRASRHFLFQAPFAAPPAPSTLRFDVRALDYARNETRRSVEFAAR